MNSVNIYGRITRPIEVRTTPNGTSVCNFTIANETGYGEKKKVNWVDCVAWGNRAEKIATYFGKGSRIAVSGKLQSREWEDKDGKKRKAIEINVEEYVIFDFPGGLATPKSPAPSPPDHIDAPLIASDFEEFETADDGDLPF